MAERSIFDSDAAWLSAMVAVCASPVPGLALQVRLKEEPPQRRSHLAAEARIATWDTPVPVFLNGETDEATAFGYDGVHLPEALIPVPSGPPSPSNALTTSGPPSPKHALSLPNGSERGLGGEVSASVHSPDAALRAQHAGADFLVAGTIFDAGSKDAPGAGLDHLHAIAAATSLPVLAIGGVTPERVASCIEAGAFGVAVVTAVLRAPDIAAAIRALREALDAARANAGVS